MSLLQTGLSALTANPCTPTLSVPTGSNPSLGNLLSNALDSISGTASDALSSLESNVTGALSADAASIVGQINLLQLNLGSITSAFTSGGAIGQITYKLGSGSLLSDVENLANQVVSSVEQQVVGAATGAITGAITSAVSQISNLAIGELQKDIGPLLNALSAINGALGQINAEILLVQQALANASSCPAKGELLAEVYFKQGAT